MRFEVTQKLKISKTKERRKLKTGEIKEYTRVRGYIDLTEPRELYVVPKEYIEVLNRLLDKFFPSFTIPLTPKMKRLLNMLKHLEPIYYDTLFAEILSGEDEELNEQFEEFEDELKKFLEELTYMINTITFLTPTDYRYDWGSSLEVPTEEGVTLYIELYPREDKVKVEITGIKY